MRHGLIGVLLKQTQHLTRKQSAVPDSELLHQYAMLGDQSAFAGLVRRHGPMVWAVCRNAVRTEADAEDAFQATFLALVRSARRIRKRGSVGAWLHGVAVRICLKSRQACARRLNREVRAARSEAALPADSWHDDIVKVHQTIHSLPRREHEVFVLTILEGLPQAEVARQLGLHVNSVSGLLSRARRRLQHQLKAGKASGLLALTLAVSAPASVPAALFTQTCGLALSTSGLALPVLALTASLTEVSMRKILLYSLIPLLLASGMTVGTFLLHPADAQEAPQPQTGWLGAVQQDGTRRGYYTAIPPTLAQKWEYKTLRRNDGSITDAELNALGDKGWEMCSTTTNSGNQTTLIFKRPRQADRALEERVVEGVPYPNYRGDLYSTERDKATPPTTITDYRTFRLQRTSASEVADLLKKVLPKANVVADVRTNTLHIQSDPNLANEIKDLIQKLDVSDQKKK